MRGSISGSTPGTNELFTFPEGFRPSSYQYYPSSVNDPRSRAFNVLPSGVMNIYKDPASSAETYVPTAGVRFYVD